MTFIVLTITNTIFINFIMDGYKVKQLQSNACKIWIILLVEL